MTKIEKPFITDGHTHTAHNFLVKCKFDADFSESRVRVIWSRSMQHFALQLYARKVLEFWAFQFYVKSDAFQ